MNGIDPKYVFWLGIVVTIETAIGQGAIKLTNVVPAEVAPYIVGWSQLLGFIGTTIMTALSGFSSANKGVLIAPPSPPSAGAPPVKPLVIVAVVLGGLLGFAGDARAQGKPLQITGNVKADSAANFGIGDKPALTGNVERDAQAIWKKIAAVTKADLTYAMAKAKAANTNASAVRLQCLQAISDANDQANGAGLKNPDGTDMVRPDPAMVTAIEDVAELVDNLSPQGKLFTSCAGAAQMFKTSTLAVINSIVTGAAGIAMLPAGL